MGTSEGPSCLTLRTAWPLLPLRCPRARGRQRGRVGGLRGGSQAALPPGTSAAKCSASGRRALPGPRRPEARWPGEAWLGEASVRLRPARPRSLRASARSPAESPRSDRYSRGAGRARLPAGWLAPPPGEEERQPGRTASAPGAGSGSAPHGSGPGATARGFGVPPPPSVRPGLEFWGHPAVASPSGSGSARPGERAPSSLHARFLRCHGGRLERVILTASSRECGVLPARARRGKGNWTISAHGLESEKLGFVTPGQVTASRASVFSFAKRGVIVPQMR